MQESPTTPTTEVVASFSQSWQTLAPINRISIRAAGHLGHRGSQRGPTLTVSTTVSV